MSHWNFLPSANGMLDIVYDQKDEKYNLSVQGFVIFNGRQTYVRQMKKYVLKCAKLHIDTCINATSKLKITMGHGFPAEMYYNQGMVDEGASSHNFFFESKAQWGTKINSEKTVKRKNVN